MNSNFNGGLENVVGNDVDGEVSKWIWTNLRAPAQDVGGAETAEEVKDSEEYCNEVSMF